ncbi:MAG: hypothetical protein RLZ51_1854 [Pseudomonadota bacterium]
MYQLERHGVQVAHVDREEHDLWVRTPSGRMLTVQVKSATEPTAYGKDKLQTYGFCFRSIGPNTDIYALVALQLEIVLFFRPEDMRRRVRPELFTRERMEASIRELLA